MKPELINHFTWLANKMAQSYLYENWSDEFARKETRNAFDRFYKSLKRNSNKELIDFDELTAEEAKELRFGKWSEDSDLYLIPLYLVPLIPLGTEFKNICGDKEIFNGLDSMDLDIRFGCTAWGIEIKGGNE